MPVKSTRGEPATGNGQRLAAIATPPRPAGRRRQLPLAAVAMLAAAGCALLFAALYLNAGERRPVLAMATSVPAGGQIDVGDLTVVRVSADPDLAPIPASQRATVIGQRAVTDLPAGTLLTAAHVGERPSLAAGEAVVGLALGAGQVPTSRLAVGDLVQVVEVATSGDAGDPAARVLAEGRVLEVESLGDATARTFVALVVAEGAAPAVASAAAGDRVSLVLVTGD